MKGVKPSTLYTLRLIRQNLEDGTLTLDEPAGLAWLCEQLSEVVYDIHEELLLHGDEVRAIRVFEDLYMPFSKMAEFLLGEEEASK